MSSDHDESGGKIHWKRSQFENFKKNNGSSIWLVDQTQSFNLKKKQTMNWKKKIEKKIELKIM